MHEIARSNQSPQTTKISPQTNRAKFPFDANNSFFIIRRIGRIRKNRRSMSEFREFLSQVIDTNLSAADDGEIILARKQYVHL